MKNLSNILHGVQFLAIIILFILVLRKPGTSAKTAPVLSDTTSKSTGGFYLVNNDTLAKYYDFYKDTEKELEAQNRAAEGRIIARQQALQQESNAFRQAVERLQNSPPNAAAQAENARLEKLQAELQKKQQDLQAYTEQQQRSVAEASQAKAAELQLKVQAYIKELNTGGTFKVVFSDGQGSPLLFSDPALDITRQVVDGLNAAYAKDKPKK
jgi:outer membrane protein